MKDRQPHAFPLLFEEVEHLRVRPVIDENERPLRTRDERQHQRPRIPELPVVEHALQRRCLRLDKEIDLALQFGYVAVILGEPTIHLVF